LAIDLRDKRRPFFLNPGACEGRKTKPNTAIWVKRG
jgi:hypothetical protein